MPYKSRDDLRAYQLQWVKARRAAWIAENGPCAVCKGDEDLEVDHTDPALKEIPVARVWGMSECNPRRIAELAKCRVLCAACHLRKSNTEKARGADNGAFKRAQAQSK